MSPEPSSEMLITLPMADVSCWSCQACIEQKNHKRRVKELYKKETIKNNSLSPIPYFDGEHYRSEHYPKEPFSRSEHYQCQIAKVVEDMCLVCQRVAPGSTEMPMLVPGYFDDGFNYTNGVSFKLLSLGHSCILEKCNTEIRVSTLRIRVVILFSKYHRSICT